MSARVRAGQPRGPPVGQGAGSYTGHGADPGQIQALTKCMRMRGTCYVTSGYDDSGAGLIPLGGRSVGGQEVEGGLLFAGFGRVC